MSLFSGRCDVCNKVDFKANLLRVTTVSEFDPLGLSACVWMHRGCRAVYFGSSHGGAYCPNCARRGGVPAPNPAEMAYALSASKKRDKKRGKK